MVLIHPYRPSYKELILEEKLCSLKWEIIFYQRFTDSCFQYFQLSNAMSQKVSKNQVKG